MGWFKGIITRYYYGFDNVFLGQNHLSCVSGIKRVVANVPLIAAAIIQRQKKAIEIMIRWLKKSTKVNLTSNIPLSKDHFDPYQG